MARVGLNGADPRPLRLVVFGGSIVSDWGNPAATTWRALLRALTAAGHDAVFLERRKNEAVVDLLRARGGEAMRAFGRAYPDVRNRSYDLPGGAERSVWFGREVSTADAAIVLDDAPEGIFEEIIAYDTPRLVKVLARTGGLRSGQIDEGRFDLIIGEESLPAVEIGAGLPASERSGVLLVAYEDEALASRVAERLAPLQPDLITPGRLPDPWRYVPESQMPSLYGGAALAVLVGSGQEGGSDVRVLLPAASGAPTIHVSAGVQADWPDGVIRTATVEAVLDVAGEILQQPRPPAALPRRYDAAAVASGLAETIRRIRSERMGVIQPA